MKKKEAIKPKIHSLPKKNNVLKPIKNKITINNSKKNIQKIPKNKIVKKKVRIRSMSAIAKEEPKKENIKLSHSLNNSLELDYLNFSQIDLFNLDKYFKDDMFTPNCNSNNQNNREKIILNRYNDYTNSTINDYSSITNNNLEYENNDKAKSKENINNTPSTICNYYGESSNKKNFPNKKNYLNININAPNETLKKNLEDYYDINNTNEHKKNEIINKIEENDTKINEEINNNNLLKKVNLLNKKGKEIILKNDIPFTNNLMANYLKNKSNFKKEKNSNASQNSNYSNQIKNKSKDEIKNIINKINENNAHNNCFIKYSKSSEKINNIKKVNNNKYIYEMKDAENNTLFENKINVNKINEKSKLRRSQQKHTNIYHNKNKFETYFITPRNFKKIKKEKNFSSTKSTKIATASIGKAKSFSSNKISKVNKISNTKNNNHDINNYKIIKEIIDDKKVLNKNKKNINKTTPKNKNYHNTIKANTINAIKVNLKCNAKSSSYLTSNKKQFSSKNNQVFNLGNNSKNKNNINNKIKSEIKSSFNTFQNIYKTIHISEIKSPDKNNINMFQVSKTLTEQNIIIHKNQVTPKNYKIQKFDSVPFTTIVKKIFVGSSKKDNLMKFDSSLKKKEKTKTEQMKCIFKPKTQSDFKPYNNMFGNDYFKKGGNNALNGEYGNDKHVKQKLLDRMNKATNNWQYIFKGNKNIKIHDEGLSNLKSQNKDKKEYYNYFYKNENIISDGSEKEDDNID